MKTPHKYPIGTTYKPGRKHTYLVTIIDRLTTRNEKGEIVSIRYVGTHEFCGQLVTDRDILEIEIARGLAQDA